MVRRLGLGKNNHLTYASLALNPRDLVSTQTHKDLIDVTVLIEKDLFTIQVYSTIQGCIFLVCIFSWFNSAVGSKSDCRSRGHKV